METNHSKDRLFSRNGVETRPLQFLKHKTLFLGKIVRHFAIPVEFLFLGRSKNKSSGEKFDSRSQFGIERSLLEGAC